jgi:RecB family exonuclease
VKVRELIGASTLMAHAIDAGTSSATSVERWATCPFRYLLQNLLKVEATRRPEDDWTITPILRGTLIHEVLNDFFRELRGAGRFGPGDTFTAADHARLDAIAEAAFGRLEAEGRTGHPLAWENARTAILADLHALLEKDEAWREEEKLRPALFERSFGEESEPDSWPAVTVALGEERSVAFRGFIDRIDFSQPGQAPRRALVIDYKTGSAEPYGDLKKDPLGEGRRVQLALYGRALRGSPAGAGGLRVTAEYRFVSVKAGFARLKVDVDEAVDAGLDQVVQVAADGIGRGVFLPEPGVRDRGSFQNCRYCDYDRVCSTTRDEAWERKHGEAGR